MNFFNIVGVVSGIIYYSSPDSESALTAYNTLITEKSIIEDIEIRINTKEEK